MINAFGSEVSADRQPVQRFSRWCAGAGALLALALVLKGILGSANSTAGIGMLYLPVAALAGGAAGWVWGLCVARLWQGARAPRPVGAAGLLLAATCALGLPGYAGFTIWRGLALERAVAAVAQLDAAGLEQALVQSPWRGDRFYLAALAQHPAAPPALLDALVRLADTAPALGLDQPLGSLWDVKGANAKGIAAIRLVALHPNTRPDTLARLADGPHAALVLGDVLRNPRTPMTVLARHFDSTRYDIEWGLALNPATPVPVLERLARSPDRYTRFNLTYNPATPRAILDALARDPDPTLATHAAQAIARQEGRRAQP